MKLIRESQVTGSAMEKTSINNHHVDNLSTKSPHQATISFPKTMLIHPNEAFFNFKNSQPLSDEPILFLGKVTQGQQLGRQWGIPTANINAEHMYPYLQGIYCVRVERKNGECFEGVASIGNRPTVNGTNHVLEVYLFNFSGNLYGETLAVTLLEKLRDEIKFSCVDALLKQIHQDIHDAHLFFLKHSAYRRCSRQDPGS